MKILDVLQKEAIISDLKSQDKKEILEELVARDICTAASVV